MTAEDSNNFRISTCELLKLRGKGEGPLDASGSWSWLLPGIICVQVNLGKPSSGILQEAGGSDPQGSLHLKMLWRGEEEGQAEALAFEIDGLSKVISCGRNVMVQAGNCG